jgi:hypothetical protein
VPRRIVVMRSGVPPASILRAGLWAAAAGVLAARPTPAQQAASRFAPEGRVDVVVARATAVQGGAGASTPLGTSFRLGAVAGVGAILDGGSTDGSRVSARVDVFGRLLVDPLKEWRWGPYVGGGASVRSDYGHRPRGYLLALLGVEGPWMGGWIPAIELGLGGGTRIGVVLQRGGRGEP